MKPFICTVLFFTLSLNQSIFAQQAYVWDEYGLSFTLPDDFKEVVSNGEEFSADGDGMSVSILPFKDASLNEADITSFTMQVASSLELDRIADLSLIKFNGFSGAYAEGASDGATIFMMGLIDPNSDTNFFVIITFAERDQVAIDDAIDICKSFKRM